MLRASGLLLLLALAPCLRAGELLVYAAASMREALEEIGNGWTARTGERIVLNLAGSGTLARQIASDAPADLFISADERLIDPLIRRGALVEGSKRRLLLNQLVIVSDAGSKLRVRSASELLAAETIAMGDPMTVPAGTYAREWLERAGLWQRLAGRVVPTENVRAALLAVRMGNVDVAIVYRTDVRISSGLRILYEVPREETPSIAYAAAVVTRGRRASAERFLRYLTTPQATRVFEKHGFVAAR